MKTRHPRDSQPAILFGNRAKSFDIYRKFTLVKRFESLSLRPELRHDQRIAEICILSPVKHFGG